MPSMFRGSAAELVLELQRAPDEDGNNLVGAGRYCIDGVVEEFSVSGNASRSGDVDDLRLAPEGDRPAGRLTEVSSSWDGDELVLTGESAYDPSGEHVARSTDPVQPFEFTLRKVVSGSSVRCLP
ncbi:MAG: hypothetical protein R2702_06525 [Acidimicrobiales bacterium]